jgi:hypothetical protein
VVTWRARPGHVGEASLLLHAALPVLLALWVLLGSTGVRAGTGPMPVLRVESNIAGEVGLEAREVTIEQALQAIASEAGFEVVITPGIPRTPVNLTVSSAPVEYVLRQILRGRNYSLVYEGDDAFLSQVIVLPPPAPGRNLPFGRPIRGGGRAARNR